MPEPSYVSGTSEYPLLGITIGAQLGRTASAFPAADAVISVHQGVLGLGGAAATA